MGTKIHSAGNLQQTVAHAWKSGNETVLWMDIGASLLGGNSGQKPRNSVAQRQLRCFETWHTAVGYSPRVRAANPRVRGW
jgi:hypothetical protein